LDFLVDLTKPYDQIIGSRMMGGGFGGCTINLIHKKFKDEFLDIAHKSYFEKFRIDVTPIEISISDGVKIKNLQTG
jgi:galactokinase